MTSPGDVSFSLPPNFFMEQRLRAYLDFVVKSLHFLMTEKSPLGVGKIAPVYTFDQYMNWLADNEYEPYGPTPAPYPPPDLP